MVGNTEILMTVISVRDAQATLPELIHRLTPGQEVLLTEDDRPVAKLVATVAARTGAPKLGTQRGSVLYMAPDFDAPLDDFREYME
jgi:antitoxin (DNA-binding transcriptional repressor) of toxin-antitoxin stability system